jgi:transposase
VQRYPPDLTEAAWTLLAPLLPAAKRGGCPRTTDMRAVINAIFYVLRGGCQWRLLPKEFPPHQTVYPPFRTEGLIWMHFYRYNHAYRLPRSWRKCWGSSVRCRIISPCPGIEST